MNEPLPTKRLPNTFLIGVTKSGTSSLAFMLAQHPDIFLPARKETFFFSRERIYSKGINWYLETHYGSAAKYLVRLDATPNYLTLADKVVPRLLAQYDDPRQLKIIAIFRNPIERAYSNYWMSVRQGKESLSFLEAIQQENDRLKNNRTDPQSGINLINRYIAPGKYSTNLRPYLAQFKRSQFYFLIFDDFIADSVAELGKLFNFLGLDTKDPIEPLHVNVVTGNRSSAVQGYIGNRDHLTRQFFRRLMPASVRRFFRRSLIMLNKAPFTPPPITEEAKNLLRGVFRTEVEELEELLDRDLSQWY